MRTQIFLPKKELKLTELPTGRQIIGSHGLPEKPMGAFWTSPRTDDSCDWLDWCQYEMPQWIGEMAVLYSVSPKARILELTDHATLCAKYPLDWDYKPAIDWSRVAEEYDGAHYVPEGNWLDCINGGFYGWDVESTAWFNMDVLRLERFVHITEDGDGRKFLAL